MPSWLKGVAKRGKRYGRTEEERCDVNDPLSDLEFNNDGNSNFIRSSSITESYHDGIAPVVIQIDEAIDDEDEQESLLQHRDERQPRVRKREWEQHSHRSIDFAGRTTNGGGRREKQKSSSGAYNNNSGSIDDSSSSTKPSKNAKQSTGTGEPSSGTDCDLEHCCLAEGACLGNAARGETNDDVGDERTEELPVASTTAPGVASSFKNADACIQQIRSAKSRPDPTDDCEATAGTQYSQQQLDTIRELGPIRDKNADQKDRHTFMVKRLYVVVAVACLLLITTIIAVTVAVKRKKANRADLSPSARRSQMKESMVSELNNDSDFETEGSAQNLALDWMANDDPAALPATPVTTELTERFAAATLYFATGGPQEWIDSFGFLSGASICEWNSSGDNTLARIGIFCGESGAVREVKLENNNLSGSMPKELNYFSELVTLNLYFNKLRGTIPDISGLAALEQIDVDGNELTGTVPESIFNMPNIVNLYLLNNKNLTGTIPEIKESSKLEAISLFGCSFVGSIPQSLTSASALRLLQLKDNSIEGTIPSGLFSLPLLETLGLDGNRFVGSIPTIQATGEGSALKSLSVGSNSFEGSLPDSIKELTSLQYLYADDNMLTGSIPRSIFELPSLEQLWLHDNKLSGDISNLSFGSNSVISDVYLGGNNLSGNLQVMFATAPSSIQRLDVSGNTLFQGYISDDIGKFDSLKYFNASACSLVGTIPSNALTKLTEVGIFSVSNNRLEGVIPSTLGSMTSLKNLELSNNFFEGEIPSELANLGSLTSFDISGNRNLGGDASSTICQAGDLVFAASDCAGNEPVRIECDCCTDCCNRSGQCSPKNQ